MKTWWPALTSVTQPFGAGTAPPLELVDVELELVEVLELEVPLLDELDEAPPAPLELEAPELELDAPLLVEEALPELVAAEPVVSAPLPQAPAKRRGRSKEAYVFMRRG